MRTLLAALQALEADTHKCQIERTNLSFLGGNDQPGIEDARVRNLAVWAVISVEVGTVKRELISWPRVWF